LNLGKEQIEAIIVALVELALGIAAYAFLPPPLSTVAIAVLLEMIQILGNHHEQQNQGTPK
jgi:hypothetical protein